MSPVSGFVLFIVIWWIVLFAVLPFGVRPAEAPERGHDPGAPANPRLARKALWTTGISLVLWGIAYLVIRADLISFSR